MSRKGAFGRSAWLFGVSSLALAMVAGTAQTAAAQTATPAATSANSNEIPEVVVTARRVTERLQDVPQTVAVINKQVLSDHHIESVYDIHGLVPGLYEGKTATLGGGVLFIRGIISQGLPNATLDTRVGIYVDGVYMARPEGTNIAMADLANVEVDEGPQGTLFGRNVTAGLIAFTTANPTGHAGGEFDASYGDYDQQRYKITLNSPEWKGFSARLTYNHDEMGGQINNVASGTSYGEAQNAALGYQQSSRPAVGSFDGHDNNALFFALHYDGVENLTVDYKADYTDDIEHSQEIQNIGIPSDTYFGGFESISCLSAGFYLGLPIDNCIGGGATTALNQLGQPMLGVAPTIGALTGYTGNTPLAFDKLRTKNIDFEGGATIRGWGHNVTLQYQVTPDIRFKSVTAYRQLTANGQIGTSGGNYEANPAYWNNLLGSPGGYTTADSFCMSCSDNRQASRQFSEEFQIIGKYGHWVDYILGAYYFNEHTNSQSWYGFNATPNFAFLGHGLAPMQPGQPFAVPLSPFVNGEFEHFESRSYAGFAHVVVHPTSQLDLSGGVRYTVDDKGDQVPLSIVNGLGSSKSLGADGHLNFNRITYDGTITYKFTPDLNVYTRYATAYLAGGFFNSIPYLPEDSWSEEVGFKSEWLDHRLRFNGDYYYQSTHNSQDTGQTAAGAIYVSNILGTTVNQGVEATASYVPLRGLTLTANASYNRVRYADGRQQQAPNTTAELAGQYDAPRFSNGMYFSFNADSQYIGSFSTIHFSMLDPRSGYFNFGLTSAAPAVGTPAGNYWALLHYLAAVDHQPGWDPATNANAETNYLTALNKASKGGGYWLLNLRASLVDIPVGGTKARVSAYVNNALNSLGVLAGSSDYGGYMGVSYEQYRTFGVDVRLQF
jgi:iron complex outermembrane receptor protein